MTHTRTVLVIEDNELNREILVSILEDSYRVLPAENGAIGLDILRRYGSQISLILLDLNMPVLDGFGFINAVQQEGRYTDIPIIVTTASTIQADEVRCLEIGATDFVTKPYNTEVVLKRVSSIIRLKETSGLLHRIEHDPATGAYARAVFMEYVSTRLANDGKADYDMLCLEIESYMLLFDRYGLPRCEATLRRAYQALAASLPENTLIGRLSDSRLCCLTPHDESDAHRRRAAQCAEQAQDPDMPPVKINCGLYAHVDHTLSADRICHNALAPIDQVRNKYGAFFAEYNQAMRDKEFRAQLILDNMEQAVRDSQFQIYYQPKYSPKSRQTVGAEALVRWIHPNIGFMSPGEFIPLFEHNGFIQKMDRYMLEAVCRQQRDWLDRGLTPVPVSINVSQTDFDQASLNEEYESIVDSYALPHDLIHFEITETAYASDTAKKAAAIKRFRESGFLIELDDFGAGYSTLCTLGELPIDVMKVDMSLIRSMFEPKCADVLKAVLYAARLLKMKVVAEGVESQVQVDALAEMSGDDLDLCIQGYYYSRPVPAPQFEGYLKPTAESGKEVKGAL